MTSLEALVFGTEDAAAIDDRIADLVAAALDGCEVRSVSWHVRSVSCVAGVVLDDGREVVARAYQPSVTDAFVDGVVRVQRHAAAAGLPAPAALSGPVRRSWGLGRVEASLPDPGWQRFERADMQASAAGLAAVVDAVGDLDPAGLDEHPMAVRRGLYPPPHSPIFDFDATAAGAEWIDEIAAAALEVLAGEDPAAPVVLAHTDWSARNVRIASGRVVAVYDWESTSAVTEASAVGVAAATWRSLGEPADPIAPDADELAAYVDAYAGVRPLDARQRRIALAKAVHGLAYTARCEHALQPGVRTWRATARLPDLASLVSSG